MVIPGEGPVGGNEANFDAANSGQESVESKSVFKRIGNKINKLINQHNAKKRDNWILSIAKKVDDLAQSDNEEDLKKLHRFQDGTVDLVHKDDRILNAVLNSFDTFDQDRLNQLLTDGRVDKKKIMANEHVRDLAYQRFEQLLLSNGLEGSSKKTKDDNWFASADAGDGVLLCPILKDILSDEKIRNQIIEDVGQQAIGDCGVNACNRIIYEFMFGDLHGKNPVLAYRKIELLKQLGFDYPSSYSAKYPDDPDAYVSSLLGDDYAGLVLKDLGFVDGKTIGDMYRLKARKLAEYANDGDAMLGRGYEIPSTLRPDPDDDMANFWREQDEKCNFDTMAFVAEYMHKNVGVREFKENTDVAYWSDDLTLSDSFFNNSESGFPLHDIKYLFYHDNGRTQAVSDDTNQLLRFFANNLDRIGDYNMRGLVSNWEKIQCGTYQETVDARLAYLKYIAQGSALFKTQWNEETQQAEDIMFFNEDGSPTDAFYNFKKIYYKHPKSFLPYIDKNWRDHFSEKEIIAIELFDFNPNYDYQKSTDCGSFDEFLDLLGENSDAFHGLISCAPELSQEFEHVIGEITPDNVVKFFDANGPKPLFWQKALDNKRFRLLSRSYNSDDIGFNEATRRFLDFYYFDKYDIPGFMLEDHTYIDNDGIEKTDPWTKNIAEYFDEYGPKPEYIKACVHEGKFNSLFGIPVHTFQNSNLGNMLYQFSRGLGSYPAAIDLPIDSSNVISALTRFIDRDADDWEGALESDLPIRDAFNDIEVKDLALDCLKKEYENFLNSPEGTEFPFGLTALSKYMHQNDGAGPLVQIEAFLDFAGVLESTGDIGKALTAKIEERMKKDHWDNQDKSNFYAVSAEVIQASPELYEVFAGLFTNIKDKKDFETFTKEIYPLYRAKLALLRNYDDSSDGIGNGYTTANYDAVDKEALKNQLHNALLPFNLQELSPDKRQEGIETVRKTILGEITELFKDKLKIRPEAISAEFSNSDIRTIEDMTLYLSNFSEPSSTLGRNLIGLFSALNIGETGGWDKLRRGDVINSGDYLGLDPYELSEIEEAFKVSRQNNPVNKNNTRIQSDERLREFNSALQEDTTNMRLGSVQTIDLRLQDLISNIEDLTDPDLYPDKSDKKRITILERYSPKSVGTVSAKMWQRASGKEIQLNEAEQVVADDLAKLMTDQDLDMTPENIKTYLQDGFNAIKIPFNIRQAVKDNRAVESISELQKLLTPNDDVSRIFSEIGEEFEPDSGALAIGSDLDYLENLIVKHEKTLADDDKKIVNSYLDAIRGKMGELEKIYDKIAQSFEKFEKSVHGTEATQLQAEIDEISKIIHGANSQTVITTTCTNNLMTIFENMRACLSAKTKGINNDTDLTFAENYKFYLYSRSGSSTNGSNTDEIIYFVPSTKGNKRGMSFVMDQIYGRKNSDIFACHLETILKKASSLKKQFPEAPITIFVPRSTSDSCSMTISAEELSGKINLPSGATISDSFASFNVPKSGFGDHYIEFGLEQTMDARASGSRTAKGIEIVL
ncbi:MAG: hypothetical protein K6G36_02715 [Candidatus Saccharibacteria bacterium]|nr:hypothetical protein [Candidatus Saccharibacteria bacterium]